MTDKIMKVREFLKEENMDYLMIENPLDVFYLTGMSFSRARLVIGLQEEILFLDGRYLDSAKEKFSCDELSDKKLGEFIGGKKLGFDSIYTSFAAYNTLSSLKLGVLVPIKNPLNFLRMIKSQEEIALLKKAASLNYKTFEYAKSLLVGKITEKEIAIEIEVFYRKNGAEKIGFDPIIAFGKNSAYPHYFPTDVPLSANDTILFDMGCVVEKYHSDMTRMVFLPGAKDEMHELFFHVKKAHDLAYDLCKPGQKLGALDVVVRDYFKQEKLDHLVKHSLGHGVGLEIHEAPYLKFDGEDRDIILKPGMVFTIEPGLYQEGLGGVRYENTVMITQMGVENFYRS